MYIDPSQVRPLFTSSIIANYRASNSPTSALQGKFAPVVKRTKYVEWNVKRYGETVATDVVRGGDGNRNQYTGMTRKIEETPFFYEYMDVMQLAGYDRAFPDHGQIDESAYNDFRETAMFELQQMQFKLDRAAELQAQEIFRTGKVTPKVAEQTNFNRKSASMVPYDISHDWSQSTVDPRVILEQLCIFMRTQGQSDDAVYDCYIGSSAYAALINNPFIQKAEQFHVNVLTTPDVTRKADGSVLMREITCGSFKVRMYTYPQFFTPAGVTDLTGASKLPYVAANEFFLVPATPLFMRAFTMVPQLPVGNTRMSGLLENSRGTIDEGKYYVSEFFDEKLTAWFIAIKSAFLCIPIAVDQMANAIVTIS